MDSFFGLLKSKTFWYNALLIVVYSFDALGKTDIVRNNPDVAAILVAVGNILLRTVTRKALSEK